MWLERLIPARLITRRGWCARCRQRPRDPNLRISDALADFCTVDPSRYCSEECVEQASARAM